MYSNREHDRTNLINSILWSLDGTQLITASISGVIYVWNLATGQTVHQLAANDHFTPDAFALPMADVPYTWVRSISLRLGRRGIFSA